MHFNPPDGKRLQGAADARRRVRRHTFVLQVPDNKADAVPCERLPNFHHAADTRTITDSLAILNRTHCRQVVLDEPVIAKEKQNHSTWNHFRPYLSLSSQRAPSLISSVNSVGSNEVGESVIFYVEWEMTLIVKPSCPA